MSDHLLKTDQGPVFTSNRTSYCKISQSSKALNRLKFNRCLDSTCQISEQSDNFKSISCSFEILRDLAVKCLRTWIQILETWIHTTNLVSFSFNTSSQGQGQYCDISFMMSRSILWHFIHYVKVNIVTFHIKVIRDIGRQVFHWQDTTKQDNAEHIPGTIPLLTYRKGVTFFHRWLSRTLEEVNILYISSINKNSGDTKKNCKPNIEYNF